MKTGGNSLFESNLACLALIQRGKVRDIYAIDDRHLLIVTTDRLSAFDVVLPTPIDGKGAILTAMSNFWFDFFKDTISNHLSDMELSAILPDEKDRSLVRGRATIARRLKPLPIEAVVRGYLAGSGWQDYQQTGAISGITLSAGLQPADRLPAAVYTPSTKAGAGQHDTSITFDDTIGLLGEDLAKQVREVSLRIYTAAAEHALQRGIIIADTKFEFGLDERGELVLIDEVLTPDSSRFWPADTYQPGISPPSFDKQFVRDYLETLDWHKTPPGPELPREIVEHTILKYQEAARRLQGRGIAA